MASECTSKLSDTSPRYRRAVHVYHNTYQYVINLNFIWSQQQLLTIAIGHILVDLYKKVEIDIALVIVFLQIWEAVDNPQGYLTRTGLYKALALTALAQQGKSINDKILESFSDQGRFVLYLFSLPRHWFNTAVDAGVHVK